MAGKQHADESLSRVSQIATLVAVLLAANDKLALTVDAVGIAGYEAAAPVRTQ